MRYTLVRTDHVQRYHLRLDTLASQLTGFRLELPPYNVVITERDKSLDALWPAVLTRMDRFRAKGVWNPYGEHVFKPFAFITIVDAEAEKLDVDIHNCIYIADRHKSHETRVDALCRALDLLAIHPHEKFN